jgi:hypothetical protein
MTAVMNSSGSGQGPVADCCEHGDEPSGSIKGGEFLDQLRNHELSRMMLHHTVNRLNA